ncbi:MAG: hypothetical protein R3A80_11535 [Bdellovibrionota bacterium]
MNLTKKRERLAKKIIVAGSFFWILFGVWGVNGAFQAAKDARDVQIRNIELSHGYTARIPAGIRPATWVLSPGVKEQIYSDTNAAGLVGNPYYIENRLMRLLFAFVACILVSFFVLYAVFVVDPRRTSLWHDAKTLPSVNALGEE